MRSMTTPEKARSTLEAWIVENRPWVTISDMLEDETDYFAQVKYDGPVKVGEAFLFVSKETGKMWHGIPFDVLDKLDGMKKL